MDTKIARLRAAAAASNWTEALRIAAKFPRLGDHKRRIELAWGAIQSPDFYRQLGFDPQALIEDGASALRERYEL